MDRGEAIPIRHACRGARRRVRPGRAGQRVLSTVCACLLVFGSTSVARAGQDSEDSAARAALERLISMYNAYEARFTAIENVSDIEENDFYIIEEQSFPVFLESFGEEEVTFLPVMDRAYKRMGILIADAAGNILYKTNQLETNNRRIGELRQTTGGIAAVSFRDLNRDGLKDIILITNCETETGGYAYRTGDVLFQSQGGFYRDWRISDKINRFGMKRSIDFIMAYVKEGISLEALYTSVTLDELLESGFQIIEEQCYWRNFEKWGRLRVVPGTMRMMRYDIFMLYLVNEQGYIVWGFQTMGDYDNLYSLKGMACRDMDGDGMKDILILGKYSCEGPEGGLLVDTRCSIFYQRTDGFAEDEEFSEYYQCTQADTVGGLVELIREYWGWTAE